MENGKNHELSPIGMIELTIADTPIYVRAQEVDVIQPLFVVGESGAQTPTGRTQVAVRGAVIVCDEDPKTVYNLVAAAELSIFADTSQD